MDMLDLDAGWGTGRLETQPRMGRAGRQPCLKLLLLQPHQVWSKPVGCPAARPEPHLGRPYVPPSGRTRRPAWWALRPPVLVQAPQAGGM